MNVICTPVSSFSSKRIDMEAMGVLRKFQPSVLKAEEPFDVHGFVKRCFGIELTRFSREDSNGGWKKERMELAMEVGSALLHGFPIGGGHSSISRCDRGAFGLDAFEDIPLAWNGKWHLMRFAGTLLMPDEALRTKLNCSGHKMLSLLT
jgi:hypothetical protein